MSERRNRDIIEEAKRELERQRATIEKLLPCTVTIHLPPRDGGPDPKVRLEVSAKLK